MTKKWSDAKKIKVVSALLLLLIIALFVVMNPPQCPDNYTQAQVDASNCIVGANIGLGLLVIAIFPFGIVLTLSVILIAFYRQLKKRPKKS